MKRKIFSVVYILIITAPSILVFNDDEDSVIINIIGLLYSVILFKYRRMLVPGWVRNTIGELVREDKLSNLD